MSKDKYFNTVTGEEHFFKHTEKRIENIQSIRKSLQRVKELINCNVTNVKNCAWLTLTYKENETSIQQVYKDFKLYNMRFQNYLKKNNFPKAEYLAVIEPQNRVINDQAVFHFHIVLIFPCKAPFLPAKDIEELWGLGFIKIKSLRNIDNLGQYLGAYLSDICISSGDTEKSNNKKIIKGGRLKYYPAGMRIYRASAGIKRPKVYTTTEQDARKKIKGHKLIYEKTLNLSTEYANSFREVYINYRIFNKKAKKVKMDPKAKSV